MRGRMLLLALPPICAAGLLWAAVASWTWRGAWRWLAAAPLAAVAAYALVVLVPDWVEDPSSHNLLPFEIGFLFWPSLPWMAVLAAIRGTGDPRSAPIEASDPGPDQR